MAFITILLTTSIAIQATNASPIPIHIFESLHIPRNYQFGVSRPASLPISSPLPEFPNTSPDVSISRSQKHESLSRQQRQQQKEQSQHPRTDLPPFPFPPTGVYAEVEVTEPDSDSSSLSSDSTFALEPESTPLTTIILLGSPNPPSFSASSSASARPELAPGPEPALEVAEASNHDRDPYDELPPFPSSTSSSASITTIPPSSATILSTIKTSRRFRISLTTLRTHLTRLSLHFTPSPHFHRPPHHHHTTHQPLPHHPLTDTLLTLLLWLFLSINCAVLGYRMRSAQLKRRRTRRRELARRWEYEAVEQGGKAGGVKIVVTDECGNRADVGGVRHGVEGKGEKSGWLY